MPIDPLAPAPDPELAEEIASAMGSIRVDFGGGSSTLGDPQADLRVAVRPGSVDGDAHVQSKSMESPSCDPGAR